MTEAPVFTTPPRPAPTPVKLPPSRWRRLGPPLVVAIAAGLAGATYLGSMQVSPTYESSATVRVAATAASGISDQAVSASNDLASQYAQLAGTDPVLRRATQSLGERPGGLDGAVSATTIAAQNLIQITVKAPVAAVATRRATAVAEAFQRYVERINRTQTESYVTEVARQLRPIDRQIARARRKLRRGSVDDQRNASLLLGNLLLQRQQVSASLAQSAAANQPYLQIISGGSAAGRSSPKPLLYALVVFLVALLIGGRLVFLQASGRASAARMRPVGRRPRPW